jgi:hypothetical protein
LRDATLSNAIVMVSVKVIFAVMIVNVNILVNIRHDAIFQNNFVQLNMLTMNSKFCFKLALIVVQNYHAPAMINV